MMMPSAPFEEIRPLKPEYIAGLTVEMAPSSAR
jgi:hypothetical protein